MNDFAPQFLSVDELKHLDKFTKDHCERLYSENNYILFKLKAENERIASSFRANGGPADIFNNDSINE